MMKVVEAQEFVEIFSFLNDEFGDDYKPEELAALADRFLKVALGKTKEPKVGYETENATDFSMALDRVINTKNAFFSYCLQISQLEGAYIEDFSINTQMRAREIILCLNDNPSLVSMYCKIKGLNS